MTKSVDQLRAELREAEALEVAEGNARREVVPVQWKFTLTPDTKKYHRLYDPTCRLYRLEGTIVNRAEAEAAGHNVNHREGGMTYVFNAWSDRLVMAIGGGTVFVGDSFGNEKDDSDVIAMQELSEFIVEHPGGGDVTAIVQRHRERRAADA
jgi:hypothetical protein